jgi:hypothetical protein
MYKLVRAMGLVVSLAGTSLLLATFAAPVAGLRGTPMTTTAIQVVLLGLLLVTVSATAEANEALQEMREALTARGIEGFEEKDE